MHEFQLQVDFEKSHGKVDAQWNDIINNIEEQSHQYEAELSVFEGALLLSILSSQGESFSHSEFAPSILCSSWKLLQHKDCQLVELLIDFIQLNAVFPTLKEHFLSKEEGAKDG